MFIDTHAHLWFEDYKDDLDEVIKRASENGVAKFVVPGTDIESSRKAIELAKKYPGVIYAAVGVHPEETTSLNNQISNSNLQTMINECKNYVVAIGEIGTDKTIKPLDQYTIELQQDLFRKQCEIALEHDLPIIVHTRESLAETLQVLDSLPTMPRGQFHCFSHDEEGIKQVLARGFYVSFCGNISWSKRVAKLVSLVPDDKLLLETDSPLMVPRDKKGEPIDYSNDRVAPSSSTREQPSERNEPANVVYLAQLIATLRGQKLEEIEKMTTDNAIRLFRL